MRSHWFGKARRPADARELNMRKSGTSYEDG
jgi:hypothetical protein